jgi:hypothetical protein
VLGFVARRLLAESVAIVLAVREPGDKHEFEGLPELALGGLDREDARALLARAIPGRLDDRVRDRIVAETRGNPLALLELPRGASPAELAGGFELPAAGDLPGHIEDHYLRRLGALPEATQRLMLLAAADPAGDATLLWRAAQTLRIDTSALAPAQGAELLDIGAAVRFRHPLVRSAAYRAASPGARQAVHEALAEVSDLSALAPSSGISTRCSASWESARAWASMTPFRARTRKPRPRSTNGSRRSRRGADRGAG